MGLGRGCSRVRVLIELSDDEAVAAAVMLPMVAADRLAPSASSHTGGHAGEMSEGSSEAIEGRTAARSWRRRSPVCLIAPTLLQGYGTVQVHP